MANYANLINLVIQDFDAVWGSLKLKGTLLTESQKTGATLVPTSSYGTLVGNLTYVADAQGNVYDGHSAILYDRAGTDSAAVSVTPVSITRDGDNFIINSKIASEGLYTANSKLVSTVAGQSVDLSSTNLSLVEAEGEGLADYYTFAPAAANTTLISGVTVAKGASTMTNVLDAAKTAVGNDITITLEEKKVEGQEVKSTTNVITNSGSAYKIKIDVSAAASGKVVSKATNTITEGFVTATDKAADAEFEYTVNASDTDSITVGIQAGSITVKSVDGADASATITDNSAGIIVHGDDLTETQKKNDYYELTASIAGLQVEAEVTEGYVSSGNIAAEGAAIKTSSGKVYIAKGKSNNQTIEVADTKITASAGSEFLDTTGKAVTIGFSDTATADITAGYITTAGNITVSGEKTVYIKEGSATAKYNITDYAVTGDLPVVESSANGVYELTITPDVSIAKTLPTAGWIDSTTKIVDGAGTSNIASKTIKVAKSVITPTEASWSAILTNRDDGKTGGVVNEKSEDIGDIFATSAPTTGDYFTVTSGFGYTVSAGYTEGATAAPAVTRYLPKAVIEHIDNGVDGEDYYQVKTGGYLPSGILKDISTFAPSYASVGVTLSGTGLTSTKVDGVQYHEITLAKGSIDAGYISKGNGSLAFDVTGGKYYLKKGAASAMPTITQGAGTVSSEGTGAAKKYIVSGNVTAASNLTVTEGYITSAEVQSANDKVTKTQAVSFELGVATFNQATHTTNASIDNGLVKGITSSEDAVYVVKPQIDSCSSSFTVTSAGYITEADSDKLLFANDKIGHNGKMTEFAIHAGTGVTDKTAEGHDNETVTANFDSTVSGAYTVTAAGTVSSTLTLDEGYYAGDALRVPVSLAVSKTMSVAHGSATIATSGTNTISTSEVEESKAVLVSDKVTGKNYVEIKAHSAFNGTATVVEGYTKEGDVTVTGNSADDTVYIEKYMGSVKTTTDTVAQYEVVSVGQDADYAIPTTAPTTEVQVVLDTANKYAQKDAVIELSPNAMGSSVIAEMIKLQKRLDGHITTASL